MYCCPNCFSDIFLQNHIHDVSKIKGKCSFCITRKHYPLLEPSALIDLFQPLFDLYAKDSNGGMLNELLQTDWNVFSKYIEKDKQLQLLSIIAGDKDIQKIKFLSNLAQKETYINKWDDFTLELRHKNRFFPKKAIEISQLSELFNYLIMPKESIPQYIFRARIDRESNNFTITEMGIPPPEKSNDGRANPKGISYFYGANNEKTAIAESRPYKTDTVYVAKFKVTSKITLIDLRDPQSTISPFGLDDDTLDLLHKEHLPFLVHLCDKLSKPVLPDKKELEYLPTQYLCELIKDRGFNGIAFKSSLEKGYNYVIFDDAFLIGQEVDKYTVSDTVIKSVKQKYKK